MKFLTLAITQPVLPALLCTLILSACGGGTDGHIGTPSGIAAQVAPMTRVTGVVQICSGQSADPTGQVPASSAIQACIDQAGAGGTLELPPGTYLMSSQLRIVFPFTLRTRGLSASTRTCTDGLDCATLKAAPAFAERYGLLFIDGNEARVDHVVLDHLTLDGNRAARLGGAARDACVSGGNNNSYGFNATVQHCSSCKVVYSASVNALCGTGLEWAGHDATIENNIFAYNGDHDTVSLWADGLSLHESDGSTIRNNRMIDNSDVGMISFGTARASITGNVIVQSGTVAFAGFMLDSLNSGDFTDSEIADNRIDCAAGKCFFAVNIGPGPWYPTNKPVFGGRFRNNTISGGTIGLNVSGTADTAQLMYIGGNSLFGDFSNAQIACLRTGKPMQAALSVDPLRSPVVLDLNYLNSEPVVAVLQSTDHCIN